MYAHSGLLSAVAGLIMMARSNSATADYGAPYTPQCVLNRQFSRRAERRALKRVKSQ
jgi:hypothetical protein